VGCLFVFVFLHILVSPPLQPPLFYWFSFFFLFAGPGNGGVCFFFFFVVPNPPQTPEKRLLKIRARKSKPQIFFLKPRGRKIPPPVRGRFPPPSPGAGISSPIDWPTQHLPPDWPRRPVPPPHPPPKAPNWGKVPGSPPMGLRSAPPPPALVLVVRTAPSKNFEPPAEKTTPWSLERPPEKNLLSPPLPPPPRAPPRTLWGWESKSMKFTSPPQKTRKKTNPGGMPSPPPQAPGRWG